MDGVSDIYRVTHIADQKFEVETKPILCPLGNNAKRKITLELGGKSSKNISAKAPLSNVQNYLQDPVPSTLKWSKDGAKFKSIRKNDVLLKFRCSAIALQEGITSRGATRKIVFKDFSDIPNELRVLMGSETGVDIAKIHREHMHDLVESMNCEEEIHRRCGTKRARHAEENDESEAEMEEDGPLACSTAMISVPTAGAVHEVMTKYCPSSVLEDRYFSFKIGSMLSQGCSQKTFCALIDGYLENESAKLKLENESARLKLENESAKLKLENESAKLKLENESAKLKLEGVMKLAISRKHVHKVVREAFGIGFYSNCNKCNCTLSLLCFYLARVHAPNEIVILCRKCALKKASTNFTKKIYKDILKSQVWLYRHGTEATSICPLCEDEMHVFHDHESTQVCHDIAVKFGGSTQLNNLFIGHYTCNRDQETRSLKEQMLRVGLGSIKSPVMSIYEAKSMCSRMRI